MKRYIGHPRVEGKASRQAHADLPPGTYEREMSKEGFFGPASFFHHRHPPTGWSSFEGPLRPARLRLHEARGRGRAPVVGAGPALQRAACGSASGARPGRWTRSRATPTATSCCSCTQGAAISTATSASSDSQAGDYIVLPRGTMWRLECAEPTALLLIEATNASLHAAGEGPGRRARDLRPGDARHAAHGRGVPRAAGREALAGRGQAARRGLDRHLPVQPAGRDRLARRPVRRAASTCATSAR